MLLKGYHSQSACRWMVTWNYVDIPFNLNVWFSHLIGSNQSFANPSRSSPIIQSISFYPIQKSLHPTPLIPRSNPVMFLHPKPVCADPCFCLGNRFGRWWIRGFCLSWRSRDCVSDTSRNISNISISIYNTYISITGIYLIYLIYQYTIHIHISIIRKEGYGLQGWPQRIRLKRRPETL